MTTERAGSQAGASASTAKTSATGKPTKTFPEFHRDAPESTDTDWSKCPESFLRVVREAFRANRFPLYLWGDPGRGKTCAAACVYRSQPEHMRVLWWSTPTFLGIVARCRREGNVAIPGSAYTVGEEHLWETRIGQPAVLFMDDVGIRSPTDAQYEMLFRLVDMRGVRPTVYTSNLHPDLLQKTYDGRISSRLLRGTVIEFSGNDRRAEGRKAVRV